ncbi:FecR family protein [Larkinella punicea]|nr:FecR family protein [Larkinella punicea]
MDKRYTQVQDFLNDDQFVEWVVSGRNDRVWQQFRAANPGSELLMEKARQLILEINEAEDRDLPSLNPQRVWEKIRHTLHDPADENQPIPVPLWSRHLLRWAAGLVLLLGIGWLIQQRLTPKPITYQELIAREGGESQRIEKVNQRDTPVRITLEDGSLVTLYKNSKLSYPTHFEKDKRNVILTGEAFFEIAKDANKPFYIYSNEVVTKVLGTSFRIRAFGDSKQVVVQVRTGRVSVYSQQKTHLKDPETSGLVLLPNQQAIYSRTDENLSRKLVDVPVLLGAHSANPSPIRYDEVPATVVLKDLEKTYGISILFNEELLNECLITTALGNESLYDKLDLICKTIGASYKEVDAQLVVESKGCQ